MKTMSIDFVRQIIEQTLYLEHLKEPTKYFGGKDQVNLMSFYEQLVEDHEVDRYTEVYRDLVDQQNRTGLIMNGTIVAPENPQMMNINSATIIPMEFTCSFRVMLKNRDQAIDTINNLFSILRGRKRDVAMFDDGKLFMVGTMANRVLGTPNIVSGDFIGGFVDVETIDTTDIATLLGNLNTTFGLTYESALGTYYYFEDTTTHKMFVCERKMGGLVTDPQPIWDINDSNKNINPPSNKAFTKYKLSLSFDTIRIDEPKVLNANEYCTISFGGSATLVSNNVMLGNDLTKVGIKKSSIKAQSDISLTDSLHWLEPLEMPSGLGIANQVSQLASSNFIQGKHNDGINPSVEYSFVLDKNEPLIYQWWKYARYGIQGLVTETVPYSSGVTPNLIYEINEIWSSWGEIEKFVFNAKATENIDIENTESDALTIKLTFEIQG